MKKLKALLINGSPRAKGCTYTALTELKNTLEQEGITPVDPYTSDDLNWTDDNSRVSVEHNDESNEQQRG